MRFTSETAKRAKQIKQGKARAAFWCKTGWANLQRARVVRWRRTEYFESDLHDFGQPLLTEAEMAQEGSPIELELQDRQGA